VCEAADRSLFTTKLQKISPPPAPDADSRLSVKCDDKLETENETREQRIELSKRIDISEPIIDEVLLSA